jgi:hypothetical protein
MNHILIRLYEALSVIGDVPLLYGKYHLTWIIAVVVTSLALIFFFGKANDKTARIIISSAWGVMLTFELLKQLINCMTISGEEIIWGYNLGVFPYQFCSTPLYVLPMAAFMKDGHKRDSALVFLSSFAIIGGLAVYIAADSVLTGHKFVDFQSMLHHGIQICMGVYIASRYRSVLTNKNFNRATIVFLFMTYLAILLNVTFTKCFEITGASIKINLFFVNPYVRYIPPIIKGIGIEKLPYPVFLFGYITLFILISYLLMKLLSYLAKRI